MLKRFLYIDAPTLTDYLSALEGGIRDTMSRRKLMSGTSEGGLDAKVLKGSLARNKEDEESVTLTDTPQARFDRLLTLVDADPEAVGWLEVMDPNENLPSAGIGAMISVECDIYIPD